MRLDRTVHDTLTAQLLVDCRCVSGAAVAWHAARRRLYWTDGDACVLWSCDESGQDVRKVALDGMLATFAPCSDGRFIAGFADGLCWLDPIRGSRTLIEPYLPEREGARICSGTVDPQGRFILGGSDESAGDATTPVWSVERGDVRTVLGDVRVAAALAFSPGGHRMYLSDAPSRRIDIFDYDTRSGAPGNPEVFASFGEGQGRPGGATVDSDGAVWVSERGGGAVQRYLTDGRADLRVFVPVPDITACCIGGRDRRRLFISTAREGMTDAALAAAPTAGGIFAVDLPVRGLPPNTYRR